MSGLSAAYTLLLAGHQVTLLDRSAVGRESSWAGGGIVSPLLPWNYPEQLSRLALRSMKAYGDWVAGIEARSGHVAEYWRCGMRIFDTPQPESALVWCKAHSVPVQTQNADGQNSLWLPDIAQVRNPRLVDSLREAVLQLGGKIHPHCEAKAATQQGGRVTSIETNQGTFSADHIVVATGAWSGIPLPGLKAPPSIRPIRGQMLLFKLEPGALDTILFRRGLYLIPRRDGHILVGSTLEDAGFDKTTDRATRERLHAEAAELLPQLGAIQPIQHWAGLRPGSPDNIPIIDRHPDYENVFVNTGHYRYGVTLAPASAELLVDLMGGNTPYLDPEPYSWQAALGRNWSGGL